VGCSKSFQTQDIPAALGQLICGGAAHRAEADHNFIEYWWHVYFLVSLKVETM
jgi:hypothetical protein